jgi:hypothetical protein
MRTQAITPALIRIVITPWLVMEAKQAMPDRHHQHTAACAIVKPGKEYRAAKNAKHKAGQHTQPNRFNRVQTNSHMKCATLAMLVLAGVKRLLTRPPCSAYAETSPVRSVSGRTTTHCNPVLDFATMFHMNFYQDFIVLESRFSHLLELKRIWGTVFCADNRFH